MQENLIETREEKEEIEAVTVSNTEETLQSSEEDEKEEKVTENEVESPDYESLAKEDLNEIKRLFPHLSSLSDIRELDNVARFGELRDSGLSVKEAFIATNFESLLASLAEKAARSDGKSHLRSAIPTVSAPPAASMNAEELRSAREIFGNLSDKEIESLYKRVSL